ncbi:MAG: phage integrase SAM-like domain-containing protein [Mangrovibacterium sp.]
MLNRIKKGDVNIQDVDYSFIADFDTFLKKQYQNNLNTAWGDHKHLKKILNIAVSLGYILKNPYNKYFEDAISKSILFRTSEILVYCK